MQRLTLIATSLLLAACSSNPTSPDPDLRIIDGVSEDSVNATPGRAARNPPATSSSGNTIGSRLSSSEVSTLLSEHNRVRADVGVGKLRWSAKVANVAQSWADKLAASSCGLTHSRGSGYGENLFMGSAGHYGVADAVRSWESEKKDYHGGVLTNSNWYPSGHYTQVVWRKTQGLGCAKSSCRGQVIVVCNYDPPGNYMGQSPY